MTSGAEEVSFRFIFDQHVNARALGPLRERGFDVVHVAEVGLSEADDPEIFLWARAEGRLVVTRNYRDFAPLVTAYARRGESFPGVLFYPKSIRYTDVGAHAAALERWMQRAKELGVNPAESSYSWLY